MRATRRLGVIPLLLVRDGSDVTLGTDFCGFGLGFRHVRLQTVSFRRLTVAAHPSGAAAVRLLQARKFPVSVANKRGTQDQSDEYSHCPTETPPMNQSFRSEDLRMKDHVRRVICEAPAPR